MQESVKEFRFTLGLLLLIPLLVSPILLSRMVIRDMMNQSDSVRSAFSFLHVVVLATVYAAIFTGCSQKRSTFQWRVSRYVLPAACKGAGYGALFMAQVSISLLIAWRLGASRPWAEILASGGIMVAFGLAAGAFGGIVVGLVREWRLSHSRRHVSRQP